MMTETVRNLETVLTVTYVIVTISMGVMVAGIVASFRKE
jgi:hypothetical protein